MSNIRISQLPTGSALTGSELVPVVQNGQTIQTTVSAFTSSPSLTQTFLTVTNQPSLPNSRYFAVGTGLGLTDTGAQGQLQIAMNGTSASLESVGNGFIAKTAANTVANRTFSTNTGLSITNGDGIAGNPVLSVTGLLSALAATSGTGLMATAGGTTITPVTIAGTSNQTTVVNGNTSPVIGLATDPIIPGNGGITIPNGSSAQRVNLLGNIRYNTSLNTYEGYTNTGWNQFSLSGGVTSFQTTLVGLTPSSATTGAVSLDGTLGVASGGTGVNTLTGYVIGNGTSAMTASATIPTTDLSGTINNAQLANSSVTYNGVTVALGATGTITAANPNALTIGTGLSGTSYDGSAPVTITIDSTVATLSGSQTLTNKSISGLSNTLTNIPNSALTNSSLTIGSTSISLGGTSLTLAGLTSITLTQDPVSDLQVATKQYVDAVASGLNYHQPVNYASTTTLPAYTYNNGTSGVGATITANANGALSFGGGSPTAGQRLLVKDEAGGNAAYNGIYTVTQAGSAGTPFILTRATDYDSSGSGTNEIDAGDYVLVLSGTNASTAWVQQTPLPIVVGTTALVFLQFNAPITYTAGTGLNLSPATTFNISNTGVTASTYGSASSVPTIAINAQGQITSASNTSIAINGNQITSGTVGSAYITGSYTGITGVGTLTAGTWNATVVDSAYGGTGLSSYTTGDLIYSTGTTTLAKLAIGSSTYIMTSSGSAPQWSNPTGITVGTATNATNTAITVNSTNADYYITVVSANTGNLPQLVATGLTANPSTGKITSGVSGGTF